MPREYPNEDIVLRTEDIISRAEAFRNTPSSKIITAAKRIVFEDHPDAELDSTQSSKLEIMQAAIRYIVEEVMELTPAQYDALYCTSLNQRCTLHNAIRKIVGAAPSHILKETMFDNKATLFRMCWPEYYEEAFPKLSAMRVFNCTGEDKGNLMRAARIKYNPPEKEEQKVLSNGNFSAARKEKRTVYNRGEDVDKLIYWAMRQILPLFEMKTSELFLCLAKPKQAGWNRYGFVKVIEARGCYPTPLDFYMLNSPYDWQLERIEDYMEARRLAELPPVKALDVMYDAYLRAEEKYEMS